VHKIIKGRLISTYSLSQIMNSFLSIRIQTNGVDGKLTSSKKYFY